MTFAAARGELGANRAWRSDSARRAGTGSLSSSVTTSGECSSVAASRSRSAKAGGVMASCAGRTRQSNQISYQETEKETPSDDDDVTTLVLSWRRDAYGVKA
jgi:hypothetical protein